MTASSPPSGDPHDSPRHAAAAPARADVGPSVQPTLSPSRPVSRHALAKRQAASDVFKPRLLVGVLTAGAFTALLWLAQGLVASAWSAQLLWWLRALQLPGAFSPARASTVADLFNMPVPGIDLWPTDLGLPGLLSHALAALVVWVMAGWCPDRARPLALLMRCAALLHGVAIAYFMLWPASFPHSVAGHAASGLRLGWWLMLLTPWLHLLIHYLLPFALWQRLALTALSLLYLVLLTPLQTASHVALLYLLGPVAMPLLHLLLGVVLPVVGLVGLYAWAVSWGGGAVLRMAADAGPALPGLGRGSSAAQSTVQPTLSQSLPPRL